ncbi:MAG: FAD-binding domain-containing protein [Gammaproteobacteria bacterium]|nr:FAD-binding domain-containing protein [Gammaproteobacteria bacterium]
MLQPTRAAALERLAEFVPAAGRAYASRRNYDFGPQDRSNVSLLSPYLRHRLLTESEVVAAVLRRHSLSAAEKFVQEVFWRTYWKGWLEMRPAVWREYCAELAEFDTELAKNPELASHYEAALAGDTDIECFNAWVHELREDGYLHNHARMWFASIWIFTLELPWQLGADFFYRHLLDGDPASNTLSWRWVAGLQTRGKHYVARPDNIDKYTVGRFALARQLKLDVAPLRAASLPDPQPIPQPITTSSGDHCALLLTEEDLHAESLDLEGRIATLAGFACTPERASRPVSPQVKAFAAAAVCDGVRRAAEHLSVAVVEKEILTSTQSVVSWAKEADVSTIVTGYAPTGPVRDALDRLGRELEPENIRVLEVQRAWDRNAWPHARRGFFPFKRHIPKLLEQDPST